MNQRNRRGFTATEKAELWDRWKRAESPKSVGRAFGKPSSSVYHLLAPHGPSCRIDLASGYIDRREAAAQGLSQDDRFSYPLRLRRDIRIQAEQIHRVVLFLDSLQPLIILPVGFFHPIETVFVVAVDI